MIISLSEFKANVGRYVDLAENAGKKGALTWENGR